jgi:hypothetical protein
MKPPAQKAVAAKAAGMTDEAVAARTGKTWGEWFAILDEAGGASLNRAGVTGVLAEHGVNAVFRQMVAAAYERRQGGKTTAPKPGNFAVSVSRTVSATLLAAYGAWERPTRRKRFLDEEISFANRTDGKTLRFGWKADASRVAIAFVPRSKTRTHVTIEHEKLKTKADATRMETYWTEALDRMQALVEKDAD